MRHFLSILFLFFSNYLYSQSTVKHNLGVIFHDTNWGQNTILWSDGSYHNNYWTNAPSSPPPGPSLTVQDWPRLRQVIDGWAAKGGHAIGVPVFWDRSQYGENSFEFREYIWVLQRAQAKNLKVAFFLLPFRRHAKDANGVLYPENTTTSSWSFLEEDIEYDSNGIKFGEPFYHSLALGSPKWANVYKWIEKFAEAVAPYQNTIDYVTIGTNSTYETSLQMESEDAANPYTVNAWNAWHASKYGTTPGAMAKRSQVTVDENKIRTAKFHSDVYKSINENAAITVKNIMPNVKYLWHGGSMTDVTFLRGAFTNMATLNTSLIDGVKHNPDGAWDPSFETKAIAAQGRINIVEATKSSVLENSPSLFVDYVKKAIDAGATEISYSFFDSFYEDSNLDSYLNQVVNAFKADGYWNKPIQNVQNPANPDVLTFKTSVAATNRWLDYREPYTPAFISSRNAHGGVSPTIVWVDDLGSSACNVAAPSISANPASINSGQNAILSASGCSGTVTWSTGQTGSSIQVSPTATTSYTATCTVGACTSSASSSATLTVIPPTSDRLIVASISAVSGQATTKRVTISNPYPGSRTYLWYIYRDADMQYIAYGPNASSANGTFDIDVASYNLTAGTLYRLYVGDTGDAGNSRHGYNTFTIGTTPPVNNACNYTNNQVLGVVDGKNIYVKVVGNCKYIAFEPGGESMALDWLYVLVNNGSWAPGVTPLTSAQIPACFTQPGQGCSGSCTPPSAPTLSASPTSLTAGQSATLTASGCSGTVSWNNGQTGSSILVSPTSTTSYTATCSVGACTSTASSAVTISVIPSSGNACNYVHNQVLGVVDGKNIYVQVIGNCKYIAFEPGGELRALDWLYVLVNNGSWAPGVTPLTSAQIPACFTQPGQGCSASGGRIAASGSESSLAAIKLLLVPNPAQRTVELRLLVDQEIKQATILDMQGRTLKTSSEKLMNIQDLIPGSYIVTVQTLSGEMYQQLLIKN